MVVVERTSTMGGELDAFVRFKKAAHLKTIPRLFCKFPAAFPLVCCHFRKKRKLTSAFLTFFLHFDGCGVSRLLPSLCGIHNFRFSRRFVRCPAVRVRSPSPIRVGAAWARARRRANVSSALNIAPLVVLPPFRLAVVPCLSSFRLSLSFWALLFVCGCCFSVPFV